VVFDQQIGRVVTQLMRLPAANLVSKLRDADNDMLVEVAAKLDTLQARMKLTAADAAKDIQTLIHSSFAQSLWDFVFSEMLALRNAQSSRLDEETTAKRVRVVATALLGLSPKSSAILRNAAGTEALSTIFDQAMLYAAEAYANHRFNVLSALGDQSLTKAFDALATVLHPSDNTTCADAMMFTQLRAKACKAVDEQLQQCPAGCPWVITQPGLRIEDLLSTLIPSSTTALQRVLHFEASHPDEDSEEPTDSASAQAESVSTEQSAFIQPDDSIAKQITTHAFSLQRLLAGCAAQLQDIMPKSDDFAPLTGTVAFSLFVGSVSAAAMLLNHSGWEDDVFVDLSDKPMSREVHQLAFQCEEQQASVTRLEAEVTRKQAEAERRAAGDPHFTMDITLEATLKQATLQLSDARARLAGVQTQLTSTKAIQHTLASLQVEVIQAEVHDALTAFLGVALSCVAPDMYANTLHHVDTPAKILEAGFSTISSMLANCLSTSQVVCRENEWNAGLIPASVLALQSASDKLLCRLTPNCRLSLAFARIARCATAAYYQYHLSLPKVAAWREVASQSMRVRERLTITTQWHDAVATLTGPFQKFATLCCTPATPQPVLLQQAVECKTALKKLQPVLARLEHPGGNFGRFCARLLFLCVSIVADRQSSTSGALEELQSTVDTMLSPAEPIRSIKSEAVRAATCAQAVLQITHVSTFVTRMVHCQIYGVSNATHSIMPSQFQTMRASAVEAASDVGVLIQTFGFHLLPSILENDPIATWPTLTTTQQQFLLRALSFTNKLANLPFQQVAADASSGQANGFLLEAIHFFTVNSASEFLDNQGNVSTPAKNSMAGYMTALQRALHQLQLSVCPLTDVMQPASVGMDYLSWEDGAYPPAASAKDGSVLVAGLGITAGNANLEIYGFNHDCSELAFSAFISSMARIRQLMLENYGPGGVREFATAPLKAFVQSSHALSAKLEEPALSAGAANRFIECLAETSGYEWGVLRDKMMQAVSSSWMESVEGARDSVNSTDKALQAALVHISDWATHQSTLEQRRKDSKPSAQSWLPWQTGGEHKETTEKRLLEQQDGELAKFTANVHTVEADVIALAALLNRETHMSQSQSKSAVEATDFLNDSIWQIRKYLQSLSTSGLTVPATLQAFKPHCSGVSLGNRLSVSWSALDVFRAMSAEAFDGVSFSMEAYSTTKHIWTPVISRMSKDSLYSENRPRIRLPPSYDIRGVRIVARFFPKREVVTVVLPSLDADLKEHVLKVPIPGFSHSYIQATLRYDFSNSLASEDTAEINTVHTTTLQIRISDALVHISDSFNKLESIASQLSSVHAQLTRESDPNRVVINEVIRGAQAAMYMLRHTIAPLFNQERVTLSVLEAYMKLLMDHSAGCQALCASIAALLQLIKRCRIPSCVIPVDEGAGKELTATLRLRLADVWSVRMKSSFEGVTASIDSALQASYDLLTTACRAIGYLALLQSYGNPSDGKQAGEMMRSFYNRLRDTLIGGNAAPQQLTGNQSQALVRIINSGAAQSALQDIQFALQVLIRKEGASSQLKTIAALSSAESHADMSAVFTNVDLRDAPVTLMYSRGASGLQHHMQRPIIPFGNRIAAVDGKLHRSVYIANFAMESITITCTDPVESSEVGCTLTPSQEITIPANGSAEIKATVWLKAAVSSRFAFPVVLTARPSASLDGVNTLPLTIQGTLQQPQVHIEPADVDFGIVCSGMQETRQIMFHNKSLETVSFECDCVITNQATHVASANVFPTRFSINPNTSAYVELTLIPAAHQTSVANGTVVVREVNTGVVLQVPFRAECSLPNIVVQLPDSTSFALGKSAPSELYLPGIHLARRGLDASSYGLNSVSGSSKVSVVLKNDNFAPAHVSLHMNSQFAFTLSTNQLKLEAGASHAVTIELTCSSHTTCTGRLTLKCGSQDTVIHVKAHVGCADLQYSNVRNRFHFGDTSSKMEIDVASIPTQPFPGAVFPVFPTHTVRMLPLEVHLEIMNQGTVEGNVDVVELPTLLPDPSWQSVVQYVAAPRASTPAVLSVRTPTFDRTDALLFASAGGSSRSLNTTFKKPRLTATLQNLGGSLVISITNKGQAEARYILACDAAKGCIVSLTTHRGDAALWSPPDVLDKALRREVLAGAMLLHVGTSAIYHVRCSAAADGDHAVVSAIKVICLNEAEAYTGDVMCATNTHTLPVMHLPSSMTQAPVACHHIIAAFASAVTRHATGFQHAAAAALFLLPLVSPQQVPGVAPLYTDTAVTTVMELGEQLVHASDADSTHIIQHLQRLSIAPLEPNERTKRLVEDTIVSLQAQEGMDLSGSLGKLLAFCQLQPSFDANQSSIFHMLQQCLQLHSLATVSNTHDAGSRVHVDTPSLASTIGLASLHLLQPQGSAALRPDNHVVLERINSLLMGCTADHSPAASVLYCMFLGLQAAVGHTAMPKSHVPYCTHVLQGLLEAAQITSAESRLTNLLRVVSGLRPDDPVSRLASALVACTPSSNEIPQTMRTELACALMPPRISALIRAYTQRSNLPPIKRAIVLLSSLSCALAPILTDTHRCVFNALIDVVVECRHAAQGGRRPAVDAFILAEFPVEPVIKVISSLEQLKQRGLSYDPDVEAQYVHTALTFMSKSCGNAEAKDIATFVCNDVIPRMRGQQPPANAGRLSSGLVNAFYDDALPKLNRLLRQNVSSSADKCVSVLDQLLTSMELLCATTTAKECVFSYRGIYFVRHYKSVEDQIEMISRAFRSIAPEIQCQLTGASQSIPVSLLGDLLPMIKPTISVDNPEVVLPAIGQLLQRFGVPDAMIGSIDHLRVSCSQVKPLQLSDVALIAQGLLSPNEACHVKDILQLYRLPNGAVSPSFLQSCESPLAKHLWKSTELLCHAAQDIAICRPPIIHPESRVTSGTSLLAALWTAITPLGTVPPSFASACTTVTDAVFNADSALRLCNGIMMPFIVGTCDLSTLCSWQSSNSPLYTHNEPPVLTYTVATAVLELSSVFQVMPARVPSEVVVLSKVAPKKERASYDDEEDPTMVSDDPAPMTIAPSVVPDKSLGVPEELPDDVHDVEEHITDTYSQLDHINPIMANMALWLAEMHDSFQPLLESDILQIPPGPLLCLLRSVDWLELYGPNWLQCMIDICRFIRHCPSDATALLAEWRACGDRCIAIGVQALMTAQAVKLFVGDAWTDQAQRCTRAWKLGFELLLTSPTMPEHLRRCLKGLGVGVPVQKTSNSSSINRMLMAAVVEDLPAASVVQAAAAVNAPTAQSAPSANAPARPQVAQVAETRDAYAETVQPIIGNEVFDMFSDNSRLGEGSDDNFESIEITEEDIELDPHLLASSALNAQASNGVRSFGHLSNNNTARSRDDTHTSSSSRVPKSSSMMSSLNMTSAAPGSSGSGQAERMAASSALAKVDMNQISADKIRELLAGKNVFDMYQQTKPQRLANTQAVADEIKSRSLPKSRKWTYDLLLETRELNTFVDNALAAFFDQLEELRSGHVDNVQFEWVLLMDNSGSMSTYHLAMYEALALMMEVLRKMESKFAVARFGAQQTGGQRVLKKLDDAFNDAVGQQMLECMTFDESSHPATGIKNIAEIVWASRPCAPNVRRVMLMVTDGYSTELASDAMLGMLDSVKSAMRFNLAVLHLRSRADAIATGVAMLESRMANLANQLYRKVDAESIDALPLELLNLFALVFERCFLPPDSAAASAHAGASRAPGTTAAATLAAAASVICPLVLPSMDLKGATTWLTPADAASADKVARMLASAERAAPLQACKVDGFLEPPTHYPRADMLAQAAAFRTDKLNAALEAAPKLYSNTVITNSKEVGASWDSWSELGRRHEAVITACTKVLEDYVFPFNRFTRRKPDLKGTLHLPGLIKAVITDFNHKKIFATKSAGGKRSYNLVIAIDVSASMSGHLSACAKDTLAILVGCILRLGIENFSIIAFGEQVQLVKSESQPWGPVACYVTMAALSTAGTQGTFDGAALQYALDILQSGSGRGRKSVIMLTDGLSPQPNELSLALRRASDQDVDVIALAVGCDRTAVQRSYPRWMAVAVPTSLPDVFKSFFEEAMDINASGSSTAGREWALRRRAIQSAGGAASVGDILRGGLMRVFPDLSKELRRAREVKVMHSELPSRMTVDIAFVLDVTASMHPWLQAAKQQVATICGGILPRLSKLAPQVSLVMRFAVIAFRETRVAPTFEVLEFLPYPSLEGVTTEAALKVIEANFFNEQVARINAFLGGLRAQGGEDEAEDVFAALHRAGALKWDAKIKFAVLIGDGPPHGLPFSEGYTDNYPLGDHPSKSNPRAAMGALFAHRVDLLICRVNRKAYAHMEQVLQLAYAELCQAASVTRTFAAPIDLFNTAVAAPSRTFHFVFVLDGSGSMKSSWPGVMAAYRGFLESRKSVGQNRLGDLVSVIQFASAATVHIHKEPHETACLKTFPLVEGGTNYEFALRAANEVLRTTPSGMTPLLIFMSDGEPFDKTEGYGHAHSIAGGVPNLKAHVVAFGDAVTQPKARAVLQQIAGILKGPLISAATVPKLEEEFRAIATGAAAADGLVREFGAKIGEMLATRLVMDYL
jgi:hypothetical protein